MVVPECWLREWVEKMETGQCENGFSRKTSHRGRVALYPLPVRNDLAPVSALALFMKYTIPSLPSLSLVSLLPPSSTQMMCWHPVGSCLKGADIFVEHRLRWKLHYLDSNNNGGRRGGHTESRQLSWPWYKRTICMLSDGTNIILSYPNRLLLLLLFGPDMF